MAGTFTYNLTTDIGKVRLRLTDTREGGWFSDTEIQYFLDSGGSVSGAVVEGAKVLLADRARRARSASGPGGSYDDRAQVQALQALITQYGGASSDLPEAVITMPALQPMDTGYTET